MSKRPFMCLYVNDYLGHEYVQLLDDIGFAFYMRMLMRAWTSDEAYRLPNDERKLMIAAGCKNATEWEERKADIMLNWKVSKDGKWIFNGRLKEEYEKLLKISKRRQVAGSKGGYALANAKQVLANAKQNLATQTQTQTQIHKVQEPKAKTPQAALPNWLPAEEWKAFTEMRQKIRKPMTITAASLVIKKLDSLRSRGHPPKEVLEQSIMHSWQGVFELKGDGNHGGTGANGTGKIQQRDAANASAGRSALELLGIAGRRAENLQDSRRAGVDGDLDKSPVIEGHVKRSEEGA